MTTGYGLGAIAPAQYLRQLYANQVGLMDNYANSGVGFDVPLGTLGSAYPASIFGSPMGFGYGMGMGMGMDPAALMNYQREMALGGMQLQYDIEDYAIDRQPNKRHKVVSADFDATAAEDVITRRIGVLQREINENKQDLIYNSYEELNEVVKESLEKLGYKDVSEQTVRAYSEKLYLQKTGKSMVDDLEANSDSLFWHGVKQGAFCGLGSLLTSNKNYKDNLHKITGEKQTDIDKAKTVAGQAISAVVTTAAAIILAPVLLKLGGKGAAETFKLSGSTWKVFSKKSNNAGKSIEESLKLLKGAKQPEVEKLIMQKHNLADADAFKSFIGHADNAKLDEVAKYKELLKKISDLENLQMDNAFKEVYKNI